MGTIREGLKGFIFGLVRLTVNLQLNHELVTQPTMWFEPGQLVQDTASSIMILLVPPVCSLSFHLVPLNGFFKNQEASNVNLSSKSHKCVNQLLLVFLGGCENKCLFNFFMLSYFMGKIKYF